MKPLMSTNIYEFEPEVVVCGSCLPNMDAKAYAKAKEMCPNVYGACLEEMHMNMVAHKIASVLRTGRVKRVIFASVDNSPHCVQLHYIRNELEKIMDCSKVELENYVSGDGALVRISPETISRSKGLAALERGNMEKRE